MINQAKTVSAPPTTDHVIRTHSPRATAAAKFRELADMLESGEIDGAHAQWRDGAPALAALTLRHIPQEGGTGEVRMDRYTFDVPALRAVEG